MANEGKKEPQTTRRRRDQQRQRAIRREVFSWIRMVVIVVIVVFVVTRFVLINATVPSGSMEETVMPKDRLIGFRFSYWFSEPERGDIVLFKYPVDESITYIKRVIGLPGETVDIRDGHIYIDGSDVPLVENYLPEEWWWNNDGLHYEVPEGCYFMLGDNRNNSADSRVWAEEALDEGLVDTPKEAEAYTYVTKQELQGKAIFTYYHHLKSLTNTANYNGDTHILHERVTEIFNNQ